MSRISWVALFVVLLAAVVAAIAIGTISLTPVQVWRALLGQGDPLYVTVVRHLRVPRVVLAALLGAGLGMSGAALQGAMRNVLAEPYLLGVSGGAAVGAVVAVTAGLAAALIPMAAFAGALGAVALAFFVSHASGSRGDPRVLLMAGVVVGAFANAVIMLILANADADTIRGAVWWMMGSVADAQWEHIAWLGVYLAIAGGGLIVWAREIDVLALGDEAAAGLGVDVSRAARRIFIMASLLAAATVAAAGLVGFVGLIVPHLVRGMRVRRHRPLLCGSAITGAALVVLADLCARTLRPPAELPLGAVTAVIGVPFFLFQVRKLA